MLNDIVLAYINKMGLMDDFIDACNKAEFGKHPQLANSGRC